ncbi:hypothetical protein C8R44DRAFT_887461 [Mycena epipterygia]|nr:hypothetical protein C8R44DRAFT_887461 [Mycena epipterygia]
MNGSLIDLEDVVAWVRDELKAESLLLLPVFHANLELSTMPSTDEMDVPSLAPKTVERILKAVRALDGIASVHGIVPASGVDIWPRFWGWTDFVNTYRDSFPHAPTEMRLGMRILRLVTHLRPDERTLHLIDTTRGLRALITKTWVLLQRVNLEKRAIAFKQLTPFLHFHMMPSDPVHLEEIIEGADGSLDTLASLVVNHLNHLTSTTGTAESAETLDFFEDVFMFVYQLDDQPDPFSGPVEGKHSPICAALLSNGIVPALASAIKVLAEAAETRKSSVIVNHLIVMLKKKLYTFPVDRWIAQAIDAGFLRGLVCHIGRGTGPMDVETITTIFELTLAPSTVYYSVVSKLRVAVHHVEDLVATSKFKRSKAFKSWQALQDIAEERLRVLEYFRDNMSKRACDNLEKLDMLCQQVAFIRQNPSEQFITVRDYQHGWGQTAIFPNAIWAPPLAPIGECCEENLLRASRSGGRMELHVLGIRGHAERAGQFRMFPLRRNTSQLHDGQQQIATDISLGKGRSRRLIDKIHALVAETDPEIVEIHSYL